MYISIQFVVTNKAALRAVCPGLRPTGGQLKKKAPGANISASQGLSLFKGKRGALLAALCAVRSAPGLFFIVSNL